MGWNLKLNCMAYSTSKEYFRCLGPSGPLIPNWWEHYSRSAYSTELLSWRPTCGMALHSRAGFHPRAKRCDTGGDAAGGKGLCSTESHKIFLSEIFLSRLICFLTSSALLFTNINSFLNITCYSALLPTAVCHRLPGCGSSQPLWAAQRFNDVSTSTAHSATGRRGRE